MTALLDALKLKEPILFIGAGFSKSIGLPDWHELVFKIIDLCEEDKDVANSFKTLIDKKKKTLLDVIDEYEYCKGKIYSQVIKKELWIDESSDGLERYKKLWKVSNRIITTNYDKALDYTGKNKEIITNKNQFELARINTSPNFLLKLHGTVDDAESCTLFTTDYNSIYNDSTLVKDVFENIIKNNVIVFIGFSMADPYVKEVFEKINTLYRSYLDQHFIITVNNQNDFSSLNIKPIDISNWGDGLDGLLGQLIENRKTTIPPTPSQPITTASTNLTGSSIFYNVPKPEVLFTGRQTEMQEFRDSLSTHSLFAIEGLGGYGKTEFAAKCIHEFIIKKENVVWLEGNSESKFDVWVQAMGYGEMLKGENKTKQAIFSGLMDLIERDEKIIFIDNFQTLTDDSFSRFIEYAKNFLNKSSIILITKREVYFNGSPPHTIFIKGLERHSIEFAKKIRDSESRFSKIVDPDLEKLCINTLGHPLAIKLSMTLLEKGVGVDSLIFKIVQYKGQGLNEVEELTKRIFDEVYDHFSTTEEEKDLLKKISVFNKSTSLEVLNSLFNRDYFIAFSKLGDKFLINRDAQQIELHPLIRELAYNLLDDKVSIHSEVAGYYAGTRTNVLQPALEEQVFYHLTQSRQWERINNEISEKGRKFIILGQLGLLRDLIQKVTQVGITNPLFHILLGDIEQIYGEWERAKSFYEAASLQSENRQVKAEGTIKLGEILYRKGDAKEAKEFFEKAYLFCKQNELPKEEARALNDLGLTDFFFGENEEGLIKLEQALVIRETIEDDEGIAISSNNIGDAYATKENFAKALEEFNKALKLYLEVGNQYGIANCYSHIGNAYRKQLKFNEALQELSKSKLIREEIGDKQGIASCLVSMGSIFIDQEKFTEALEKFNQALIIQNSIGDKISTAITINNIGIVYKHQGKTNEALKQYNISLALNLNTGNKRLTADLFHNIASLYSKNKSEYKKSISFFFKAIILYYQMGVNRGGTLSFLKDLRDKKMGRENFKKIAYEVFNELNEGEKKCINIRDICKESMQATTPSKNQPCTCGSGKLYKRCCGKD